MANPPQQKQLQLFPDLPHDKHIVDLKTGIINHEWLLFFDQLVLAAQSNFQKEGVRAPSQTAADIAIIGANPPGRTENAARVGNIIYDTDNNVFKVIVGPASSTSVKTITVT
jgi:hypothetical protein